MKSPAHSTPSSGTLSLKKKKQKKLNTVKSPGGIASVNERGTKRPHSPGLDDSLNEDMTSLLNDSSLDQEVPNAKRARVRSKPDQVATKAAPSISSPSKQPISFDRGQKALLLGAIRQRLAELDSRTLYIRKLPRNTTLAQLKTLCPTSVTARIQTNKHAKRRKHAFIEFKSEELARAALASVDGKLVADRPVKAEICSERQARPSSLSGQSPGKQTHWVAPDKRQLQEFCLSSLYVTCVPRVATQDEVRQLFPKADSFDFHMNIKQNSIGSCRVIFENEQDAFEAFKAMHGTLLHDSPLIVNFAFKKHCKNRQQLSDPLSTNTLSTAAPQANAVPSQTLKPKKPEPKQIQVWQRNVKSDTNKKQKKSKPDKDAVSIPTGPEKHASSFKPVDPKPKVLATKKKFKSIQKKHNKGKREKQ